MLRRSFSFDLCRFRGLCLYGIALLLLLLLGARHGFGQAPLALTAETTNDVCGAMNGTITAKATGGAAGYQYALDGRAFSGANVFTNLPAGAHMLTVKDATAPVPKTVSISVTVKAGCITIRVNKQAPVCVSNGSLTIIASGGVAPYQYSRDGKNFQASNVFDKLAGGTYTITVEDANNTIVTQADIVLVGIGGAKLDPPVIQAATCVNNNGAITVTATGGLVPLQYSLDNGAYGAKTSFNNLASGQHTVTVQDGNQCLSTATVTVPLKSDLTLSMGPDATICQGKTVTLQASSNAKSFSWSPAASLDRATAPNPVARPPVTTAYTVTASFGACTQTGVQTIKVNPAPVADAGKPVTTCYGKSVSLQGSGGLAFRWRPVTFLDNPVSANPTVVQPTATTTYHLQVTDANQCTSLNDASIVVTVTPPPQLFAGNDTNVVAGQPVPLHAVDVVNSGFGQYQWTPPDGLSNPLIQDPVATLTKTTTYVVTGTTAAGCQGVDTVTIKVFVTADIYVPNAFTPNHDGHNDLLRVTAPSFRELRSFAVYDRWGAQVFSTTNPAIGWDGTWNGKVLPPGVFVWVAVGVDYQGRAVQRRGTVMLIR